MPLCPRCTGMHIGFIVIFIGILFTKKRVLDLLPKVNPMLLIIAISIMGIEWFLANKHYYSSTLTSRLLTGFIAGSGIGLMMLLYQFRYKLPYRKIHTYSLALLSILCLLLLVFTFIDPVQKYWFYLLLILLFIVAINLIIVGTTLYYRISIIIKK